MAGMTNVALPEDRVHSRCGRLLAVQHAVAEITGGHKNSTDPESMRDAVLSVRSIIGEIPNSYACFIGGVAVQEHGRVRFTDNVDVVADSTHYEQFRSMLVRNGFAEIDDCVLRKGKCGVLLKLFSEGRRWLERCNLFPHPSLLGQNGDFATVAGIIRLKLDGARRMSHEADIVELLKLRIDESDAIALQLPVSLQSQYAQLVVQARRELGNS